MEENETLKQHHESGLPKSLLVVGHGSTAVVGECLHLHATWTFLNEQKGQMYVNPLGCEYAWALSYFRIRRYSGQKRFVSCVCEHLSCRPSSATQTARWVATMTLAFRAIVPPSVLRSGDRGPGIVGIFKKGC